MRRPPQIGDATEPAWNRYMLTGTFIPCGIVSSVTPPDPGSGPAGR